MALRVPLPAEIALARAAAGLSRLAGTGGGTTLPGKLLSKLDPGAIDLLAARLPEGAALVSATNGKTTTTAMAAEILRPRFRLAHNTSGANLVSGVTSTLLAADGAERGPRSSTPPTPSTAWSAARRTSTGPRTSGTSATTPAPRAGMRGRPST